MNNHEEFKKEMKIVLRDVERLVNIRVNIPIYKERYHMNANNYEDIKKEFTDLIILDLEGKTKEELLLNISKYAKEKGIVKDEKEMYDTLIKREKILSTGLGDGIALPQAENIEMDRPYAYILCRTKEPVDYNSLDGKSVRILIACLISSDYACLRNLSHLTYFGKISKMLRPEKSFKQGFLKAKYINEVYRLFAENK